MSYSNLKAMFADDRIHVIAARVAVHDGETRHWRVNEEGDYVVTVLTLQHEVSIDANWKFPPGQFSLPEINDEVLVAFDDGEFEGEAYIVGRTNSGITVPDGEAGELVPGQHIVLADRAETRASSKVLLKSPVVEAKNVGVSEPTLKATTYRSAEDSLFTALGTLATAIGAYATAIKAIADPTNAATPVLLTAIGAFQAAISTFQGAGTTYLTTVFKAE